MKRAASGRPPPHGQLTHNLYYVIISFRRPCRYSPEMPDKPSRQRTIICRRFGAPSTIRTCDLCLRRAILARLFGLRSLFSLRFVHGSPGLDALMLCARTRCACRSPSSASAAGHARRGQWFAGMTKPASRKADGPVGIRAMIGRLGISPAQHYTRATGVGSIWQQVECGVHRFPRVPVGVSGQVTPAFDGPPAFPRCPQRKSRSLWSITAIRASLRLAFPHSGGLPRPD